MLLGEIESTPFCGKPPQRFTSLGFFLDERDVTDDSRAQIHGNSALIGELPLPQDSLPNAASPEDSMVARNRSASVPFSLRFMEDDQSPVLEIAESPSSAPEADHRDTLHARFNERISSLRHRLSEHSLNSKDVEEFAGVIGIAADVADRGGGGGAQDEISPPVTETRSLSSLRRRLLTGGVPCAQATRLAYDFTAPLESLCWSDEVQAPPHGLTEAPQVVEEDVGPEGTPPESPANLNGPRAQEQWKNGWRESSTERRTKRPFGKDAAYALLTPSWILPPFSTDALPTSKSAPCLSKQHANTDEEERIQALANVSF